MEQAQPERRLEQRFAVDAEATVVLVNHGARLRGRLTELSLDGCRLHADRHCALAAPASIEVMFKLNGIDFRLGGTMQWADARQMAGIQFGAMAPRRRDFLLELLSELEAEKAKEEAKSDEAAACAEAGQVGDAGNARGGAAVAPKPAPVPVSIPVPVPVPIPAAVPVSPIPFSPPAVAAVPVEPAAGANSRERRSQKRHVVDSRASIFFVDVRALITGRILNVSLGGCRIQTDERFPVGIYRRVETEFTVDGVPLRLAGVVQSIYDKFNVGIRFLDMSERKRKQVTELIEEIEEQGLGTRD